MEPSRIANPRTRALIVCHPDECLVVFAAASVDIHIARVCAARTRSGERVADEILEMLLPGRYRELYRADLLRAIGSTRPLKANVLTDSLALDKWVAALNDVACELTAQPEEELITWTL